MQQLNAALAVVSISIARRPARAMPHYTHGGPHRHAVVLEPGTRMEEIYGVGEIRVNSAIISDRQPYRAAHRRPLAGRRGRGDRSDRSNWFCIGVQWHPESRRHGPGSATFRVFPAAWSAKPKPCNWRREELQIADCRLRIER